MRLRIYDLLIEAYPRRCQSTGKCPLRLLFFIDCFKPLEVVPVVEIRSPEFFRIPCT